MKIALIGGTGYVGSKILAEALRRGHKVTAIVRHPQRLAPRPNLRIKEPTCCTATASRASSPATM